MATKENELDAVVSGAAEALKTAQMESMREALDNLKPGDRGGSVIPKRVNPFVHKDRIDSWEVVKIICGFVIVPLRLLAMLFFLSSCVFFFRISMIGCDRSKPLVGWRRSIQIACNYIFVRGFLFAAGIVYINVKGAPAPSTSPYQGRMVVVAPHSSFMDGFIVSYLLNTASVVAKKEAANGCLMGTTFIAAQSILVDRKSKTGRHGALEAIIERVQSDLPWRHLYLFPEGTCTNRRALINFKIGAFAPARPVQPVLLRWGRNVNFNPAWTSAGPNRLWMIYRFLCQVYTKIDVEFLPVYVPNEIEREDAGVFAAGVRSVMAAELGVPTTDHSYEDSFLAAIAHKNKLDPQAAMPHEFVQLSKLYDVSYDDASRLLKRFTEVKKKKKNYVASANQINQLGQDQVDHSADRLDLQEFSELLGLPLTEPVIDFFSYLDVTGEGSIDFPAFLVGLTFLSKKNTIEESAKLIWATLDREGTGSVKISHIKKVLDLIFRRIDNRTIPILKESKGKSKTSITYEEFVSVLRMHPEYIPVGLHISSLAVENRPQNRLSIATANTRLNEKEAALKNAVDIEAEAAALETNENHRSFDAEKDMVADREKTLRKETDENRN